MVSAFNFGALCVLAFLCFPAGASKPSTRAFKVGLIVGCLGMTYVHQLGLLIACGVLAGAGYGGLIVRVNAFVARSSGDGATRALNLVNAAFGAGAIIGPILAGTGVQHDFLACAFSIAVCAGTRAIDEPHAEATANGMGSWSMLAPFIIVALLYAGLETGIGSWGSSDLIGLGYSVRSAAELMGLFWAGLTIGRLGIHLIKDRFGPLVIVTGCVAACGLFIFLALISPTAPAAYALTGIAVGPILPTLVGLVAQRAGNVDGATAGIFLAEAMGNIAMPLLIGGFVDRTSVLLLPFVVAMVATAILGVSRTIARPLGAPRVRAPQGTH
jgi:fucose permease